MSAWSSTCCTEYALCVIILFLGADVNQWHAVLSEDDIDWTNKEFSRIFDKKPFNEITLNDFGKAYQNVFKDMTPNPSNRTFAGYVKHFLRFKLRLKILQSEEAGGWYLQR